MHDAAAATPLELPQTLEELAAVQNDLLAQNAAVMAALERKIAAAVMTQGELTELMVGLRRLADIEGVMLEVRDAIRGAAAMRTLEQARRGALVPVPGAEAAPRRRGRRRRPGERPLYPAAVAPATAVSP